MGASLLFTLAFVVAVIGVVLKRRRARTRGLLVEDAPVVVASFEDVDAAVRATRCGCGWRMTKRGEGPLRTDDGEAWRVVLGCDDCGARRALVFRVAS